MTHRSVHLPIYTMLVGLLIISVGFNVIAFGRLVKLQETISASASPVNDKELHELMKEVERLSKQTYTSRGSDVQYDAKTKEPISRDF